MEQIEVMYKLEDGAFEPKKAHPDDAGFDIRTPKKLVVRPNSSGVVDTGVRLYIPSGYVGFLKSKSGLNVSNGITSDGVIDAGYTGTIVVKLYNNSGETKIFDVGDKITQVVFLPIPDVVLIEGVGYSGDRGDNGFGSTGK